METASLNIFDEFRILNNRIETAFDESDVADLASMYTADAALLPTGSDIIRGREAIQNFWQTAIEMGIKHIKLDTLELEHYDGVAVEMGQYIFIGEGNIELDNGKYVGVWKQENGQWKLSKDIWNSSLLAV